MSEREINQIRYIVRTSFALGYAKGRGGEFDQGPELEHMIQQTLEMLGLAGGRPLHPGIIPGADGASAPGRASQCR